MVWPVASAIEHAVVTVAHEVQVADPVDVDRWHGLAAALGQREPLPPLADPCRGRAEPAVEVAARVDRADDGVELDHLEAEDALALEAERGHHLVERQDEVDVVGLAAERR